MKLNRRTAPVSEAPLRLAIVGRPNVGKSTLFNRLLGRRRALVHDEAGVTRDRLEEIAQWWVGGVAYAIQLIDTGGLGGERFADEIAQQVDIALNEADMVVIVFDGKVGITPADRDVLRGLSRSGALENGRTPLIGIVNKVDAEQHEDRIADFFELGLENLMTISAEHARGIDDLQIALLGLIDPERAKRARVIDPKAALLAATAEAQSEDDLGLTDEELSARADENEEDAEFTDEADDAELDDADLDDESELEFEEDEEGEPPPLPFAPRIAIVGRPNVGKSTTINTLLGQHRMITSPIAGTTIDAVDSTVELEGQPFVLIDTAGIRRKSKTERGVEVLSVVQARKALERCDVAILVIDGETGLTDQDEKIGGLIEDVGCSVILMVNKWDTQKKTPEFTREIAADVIRKEMGYLRFAPILFASAKNGTGFSELPGIVTEILQQRRVKVKTNEFTQWVRKEAGIHNPMNAKFYMSHQSGRNPPTFVFHVSDPEKVHFSLRRHLVNAIRKRWGFMGNPVRMHFVMGEQKRRAKSSSERERTRADRRQDRSIY